MKKLNFFKTITASFAAVLFMAFLLFVAGCGDGEEVEIVKTPYTLTFDSQGGSSVSSITRAVGTSVTLPAPTRNGYTFNGWYSAASDGTKYGDSGDSYTITGDVTMFAQWTIVNYTITFDSQGGTFVSPITQVAESNINLPAVIRNGYTFNGWFSLSSDGTRYGGAGDSYTLTGDVTMFAQWTPINYTLIFDSQGGSSVQPISADYDSDIILPTPTRNGYTFNGWFSENGETKHGGAGDSYTLTGNVTMFAQWVIVNYTITFDSQGGSNVEPISAVHASSITLPMNPTRNGYTFDGWFSEDGETEYGGAGDSYTLTGDVTMFAQWTPINYTITFNSQGGSNVQPINADYDSSIILPTSTYIGYMFNGWFSSSSGGNKYDSPYKITGDVTMFAQFADLVVGSDGDSTINGIECVLVKAGTFTMGSPPSEEGRYGNETQHTVMLTQDYWISKYQITSGNYDGGNTGAVLAYWQNADEWARNKGGRLPTEAEWEFAARGGNKSQGYIYSGSNNLDEVGWYNNNGNINRFVGQKNPNELGIYDMSGNVWEWCSDWYATQYYLSSEPINPTGPATGSVRVIRGGSRTDAARYCRVAYRGYPADQSTFRCGFRVVFPVD